MKNLGLGIAAAAIMLGALFLAFPPSSPVKADVTTAAAMAATADPAAVGEVGLAAPSKNLVVSAPASASAVTVYGAQVAQVQESREIKNVPAGRVFIQLSGIAAKYRTDSLRLIKVEGPGAFKFREAAYQAPNSAPERLLQESVGKQVTAYRHNGNKLEPVTGILQSVNGNQVAILSGGSIEIVGTGDVSLGQAPRGVTNTASLVLEAEVETAGTYTVEFLYSTDGFAWSAKHSLIYNEEKGKLDSWATTVSVVNDSGTSFKNATVKLISGKVAEGIEDAPGGRGMYRSEAAFAPASVGSDGAAVDTVGDQNSYTLPGTVHLVNGQARQIPLFDAATYGRDVPVTKTYVVGKTAHYGAAPGPQQAGIRLTVENCEKHNLGKPLPAGSVEVLQAKTGTILQLTGSTKLGEKATDEIFDLNISTSSEVKWDTKVVSVKQVKGAAPEDAGEEGPVLSPTIPARGIAQPVNNAVYQDSEVELTIYNYKRDKAVDVKVEINAVLKELPAGWKQAAVNKAEITVKVDKSGKATVKYTLRQQIR